MTTPTQSTELDETLRRLFADSEDETTANTTSQALDVKGSTFTDMFEVLEVYGRGAEGKVYRVKEIATGDIYTAKLVSCFTNSSEHRDIEGQIQALRRLNHPNIPSYVDCLVEEKPKLQEREYILLTEDIQGMTVAEKWHDQGSLPREELENILDQTLLALEHAHSQGVTHRDIKPENILLTPEGEVKLIDWGVAKIEGHKTRLTTVGVVGSPGYMAPEVVKGEKATAASDLYSLGTTLIAAARGEHVEPFDGAMHMQDYLRKLELGELGKRISLLVKEKPKERKFGEVEKPLGTSTPNPLMGARTAQPRHGLFADTLKVARNVIYVTAAIGSLTLLYGLFDYMTDKPTEGLNSITYNNSNHDGFPEQIVHTRDGKRLAITQEYKYELMDNRLNDFYDLENRSEINEISSVGYKAENLNISITHNIDLLSDKLVCGTSGKSTSESCSED